MSHFGDFMDGVPVKISEKYKRPPRIELPYNVIESPVRAQNVVDGIKYCTTFERNVLSKLKELRSAKEIRKSERRHRLQLLEEAKQKKLDAIAAAEAEERLKQLSVSEVSYPSTDEISAISPDERQDKTCETSPAHDSPETEPTPTSDANYGCTVTESQLNILQPIQVQSSFHQNNLLDDPDPLQELKMTSKINKIQYNRNVETLTFKDFENDTSSPFDNVELKTINDMEQLAQVLQSQNESSLTCQPQQSYPNQTYPGYVNCATQAQAEGVAYLANQSYADQSIQRPGVVYSAPQPCPVANGYYMSEPICDKPEPIENVYMPNYHYYVPNPYSTEPYYNQIPSTSAEVAQAPNSSSYIPHPYYYHCPQLPMQYMMNTYNAGPDAQATEDQNQNPSAHIQNSQSTVKSRSRSVPDIVKELNEELASAKLRAAERSCNASPAPVNVHRPSSSDKKEETRSRRKPEHLPNPFDKLPLNVRALCLNIHKMGFPLDRVARVCSLVGVNDKKIIEGLLIMDELMDLGFTESRVSAVLAKHEFNKDKALDELVS